MRRKNEEGELVLLLLVGHVAHVEEPNRLGVAPAKLSEGGVVGDEEREGTNTGHEMLEGGVGDLGEEGKKRMRKGTT